MMIAMLSSRAVKKESNNQVASTSLIVTLEMAKDFVRVSWPTKGSSKVTEELDEFETFPPSARIYAKAKRKSSEPKYIRDIPLYRSYILKLTAVLDGLAKKNLCEVKYDPKLRAWEEEQRYDAALRSLAEECLTYDPATIQTKFDGLKLPLNPWQTSGMKFIELATSSRCRTAEMPVSRTFMFPRLASLEARQKKYRGAILADQMGLGKTFVINALLKLKNQPAVVVCPAGLCLDWQTKIEMLTSLSSYVVGSSFPAGAADVDIVIVSYGYLKRWGWYLNLLMDHQNRVLVFDEGQDIRNSRRIRTKVSLLLASQAKYTVILTGTPLVNNARDLYPLLVATRRLWAPISLNEFIDRYENDTESSKLIPNYLKGVMCRRLKEEVWDQAPEKKIGELWLKLDNRHEYISAEKNFLRWLKRKGASFEQLTRAARGHALVKLSQLRQLVALGKVTAAAKIIKSTLESGERAVVFCSFNEPLHQLATHFQNVTGQDSSGVTWKGAGVITGATNVKHRKTIISNFQSGKLGVLFIATEAGGRGIDLTAASICYFLDLPLTPAAFEQASDRIHRLGQTKTCQIIKLLSLGTIDQRIQTILENKAYKFSMVVGDPAALTRVKSEPLTKEILKSYLSGIKIRRKAS